ncbi:unnamed protein product [Urochloa decumbens]|uniref:Zinc finger CCCH domain-containing protein 44 n=1 Tax=Urochloa decumbens TaxID=240449 RepID=A0ABC8VLD1_9POAL
MSSSRMRHPPPEMECCFLCKEDSDPLRACDLRGCRKLYHPCCLENKNGILPCPDDPFICDWHICFNCRQTSHFQCLCCPISVCHDCLGKVGFVELRNQQKGFCTSCLNKAILIEKDADPDPRWVQSDYSNAEIAHLLFKDYWEDVKDREHLSLVYLEEAHVILKRKHNRVSSEKSPDEDHKSDANMFAENATIEKTIPFDSKGKQDKVNTSLKKNKSNNKTDIGWCSEELMQFLSSSGKDTSKSLDEAEIVGVIMQYIKQEDLFMNNKKTAFLCDAKLYPLFGRRKVSRKSIRKFLAVHLAANAVSEDESFNGSEDNGVPVKKKKACFDGSEDDDVPYMMDVTETSKGNTNTFIPPESTGAKQKVAYSSTYHREEPPKAENVRKCLKVLEEKPTEGNTNTLLLPFSRGETQGANSSNDLQVQPTKGATEDVDNFLNVCKEKSTKDAQDQMVDSSNTPIEESSEAGEARHSGVTPDSALLSQMHNTQDGSSTEAMDIDKDESKYSRHKNNGGANIEEAIHLDSDEDEDLHIVENNPESKASYALRTMSDGHLHMEKPESTSLVPLHCQGAMNGVLCLGQHEAARHEAMSAVSPLTPMWNYVDPQGNTRGPFPLTCLFRWSGFFDKDFKVWRTGETAEQAILLTDAFHMYL